MRTGRDNDGSQAGDPSTRETWDEESVSQVNDPARQMASNRVDSEVKNPSLQKLLPPVLVCMFGWWLVPLFIRIFPRGGEGQGKLGLFIVGVVMLVVVALVCRHWRNQLWIAALWIPPVCFSLLASLSSLSYSLEVANGLRGPGAPLEGYFAMVGLCFSIMLSVCTLFLIFCCYPRRFSMLVTVVSILNTIAVGFMGANANFQAERQDLALCIIDSGGRPIAGAEVRYDRFGSGPLGRHVSDGCGGPLLSDAHGVTLLQLRKMRSELKGSVHHPDYRTVWFTVEMQYSRHDSERGCSIGTDQTPEIACGTISTREPLSMRVYLPPLSDTPNRANIKRAEAVFKIGDGDSGCRYVDIETGVVHTTPSGDIQCILYFEMEGQYERARLRIKAMKGAAVQQCPPHVSLSEPASSYEHVFRIAPKSDYRDEVIIEHPGDIPGPNVYLSARDGRMFARLSIDVNSDRRAKTGACRMKMVLNTAGRRNLE